LLDAHRWLDMNLLYKLRTAHLQRPDFLFAMIELLEVEQWQAKTIEVMAGQHVRAKLGKLVGDTD
jgi:hypothetical protein